MASVQARQEGPVYEAQEAEKEEAQALTLHPKFYLNLAAMVLLGAGGIISLFPIFMVPPQLQGALWGGLLAWLAASRANGTGTS